MKMNYFVGFGMHIVECGWLLYFIIIIISWYTFQVNQWFLPCSCVSLLGWYYYFSSRGSLFLFCFVKVLYIHWNCMPQCVNLLASKIICIISYVDNCSQGKSQRIMVVEPIIQMELLLKILLGLIGTSYSGDTLCWWISSTVNKVHPF